ncbi:SusC/RagA family TonB-linked outer membrane protein [Thalassobellus suaedae]|uniref:SusC/RagA family TonB-linked outer membrane protein n=1 Tax=Thalassobellus suaedae TaxID=3074124 RepID=A0ABY9XSU4_9FLAO|nr:SusC/RagA family TonB-linked outer membrane protein [Flavobacteriaceae bacterium HL-DH14]
MKLTTLFLIVSLFQLQANEAYSQKTKVSLNLEDVTIIEVLNKIESLTEYKFLFNYKDVDYKKIVSIKINKKLIFSVLDNLFKKSNITYEVLGKQIILKEKQLVLSIPKSVENTKEQGIQITGTISDGSGQPLPGANVLEKGTTNGTQTDFDGNFSITVSSTDATLVVSYIGFTTQEISVDNQTNITINLVEDTAKLDEVVVIGYGSMKKKDLTGSIVQVKPENLANQNPQTIQDVLRGVPGLKVGYSADAKGGGSLQIRGQTSVYTDGGHNSPLIILDGMQFYGELSEINPDNIEQIDILKDASSTAVYGSKAASGVIIITTKKGKRGKPVINFNTSIAINTKSAYRDVYSPEGYLKYREDWETAKTYGYNATTNKYEAWVANQTGQVGYFANPNKLNDFGISQAEWLAYQSDAETAGRTSEEIWGRRLGIDESPLLDNFLAGNTHDWYNSTFRTGINKDHNVSVSGANDKVNYYLSMGYLSVEGAVKGNDYSAIRANMKVNGKINNWLEIGANVNFQDRTDGDIRVGTGTNYWDANMLRNSPYSNFTDENGNYERLPMGANIGGYNYFYDRQFMELEKGYTVLNTIFNAKVKLPLGITYALNVAPRYQFFHNRYFQSADHEGWDAASVGVDREQSKRFDWNMNNTLTWDHTFNNKHHIIATFVQEAEERRFWSDIILARNIQPSDALGFHNTSNATLENSDFSSTDTHQTADALMGRLFYSYDNRYLLTTTVRRDGYSAFGASNPYATFPSVALGWDFTNESWFNWKAMNRGKLRLSWGKNGNRSLADPYVSLANLTSGTGATMGYVDSTGNIVDVKYLLISRMANPNLQWEKTTSTNIGLDFGFINNRITGSIDLYNSVTNDMIMQQRLPSFSGFSSITTNLGEVENKGFELSINSVNIKTPNFEWRTSFAFSYNKNTINKLYGNKEFILDEDNNIIEEKEADDISNGWFIGKDISEIWDYEVTGIWQKDEWEEAEKYGQRPGDPQVANNYTADDTADGKPIFNDKDKVFLGKRTPPINWSIRNEFTFFKNWEASFNLYSFMGHKSLNGNYLNNYNSGSLYTYNFNPFVNEYWTIDNPNNDWARLDARGPSGAAGVNKLYNRNFIRLDNISVAYTLPKNLTDRLNIQKIKFSASVRNVATWSSSNWKYFGDPETGGLATRTFNFGFNITL